MENERYYSLSEGIGHLTCYLDYLKAQRKFKESKNAISRFFYAFNLKKRLDKCGKILPEDAKETFSKLNNINFSKKTLKEILLSTN